MILATSNGHLTPTSRSGSDRVEHYALKASPKSLLKDQLPGQILLNRHEHYVMDVIVLLELWARLARGPGSVGANPAVPYTAFMNRRMAALSLPLLFALGCDSSASPEKKSGSEARGPEKQEERTVEAFEGVFAHGKVKVVIKRGPASAARLSGPDNYLKDLQLRIEQREVRGRNLAVLVAELKKGVKTPLPVVELSVPKLAYMEADGPAQASVDDFSSAEMIIVVRGAARVDLKPAAYGKLDVTAEYAGRINAAEVMAEVAHAKASGDLARIQLGQVGQLKRESEGGKIIYKGEPEFIK